MTIPIFIAPPLPLHVPAPAFLADTLSGSLVAVGKRPFVTPDGWHGTLHEFSRAGAAHGAVVAAEVGVGGERALAYAVLDSPAGAERHAAIDALTSRAPRFRGNLTLADLVRTPDATDLPAPPASPTPLFAEMRRGWSTDGVAFLLSAAPRLGRVEVSFASPPRLSVADELATRMAADGAPILARETFCGTTHGGEYFVLARARGAAVERALGAVHGDHHSVVVDARYALEGEPDKFRDFVGRLLREIPLRGCPALRTRRVVHAVPAGWAVRTRDLTTHLFAPDGTTHMTVLPAEPREPGQDASFTRKMLYEDVLTRVEFTTPITATRHVTPHGLRAEICRVKGVSAGGARPFTLLTAVLTDARYRYVVRYVDATPTSEPIFVGLVDSIEPVPVPARPAPLSVESLRDLFPVD